MAGEHSPGRILSHKFEDHLELGPDRTANLGLMQVTGRTQSPAMVCAVALGHFSQDLSPNRIPTLLWFQLLKVSGREGNLIAIFQDEHSRVLQQLQAFTFFPESQAAPKKTFERKSMERQSARRQPLIGLVSSHCPVSGLAEPRTATHTCLVPLQPAYFLQSDDIRAALLARYPPESLFQADRNFNAAQDLDVSLLEGDIVGVIKKKDPMGSQNRWLIDNGGRWLFPALGACSPVVSLCLSELTSSPSLQ